MIVAVMVKLLKLTEFGHPASLGLGLPHSQSDIVPFPFWRTKIAD